MSKPDLELLKRKRGGIRAAFTRTNTQLTEILTDPTPKLEEAVGLFSVLEGRYVAMQRLDEEILDILYSESGENGSDAVDKRIADEFVTADDYSYKYHSVRVKMDHVVQAPRISTSEGEGFLSSHHTQIKLPKLELVRFSGDISEWINFWAQFSDINENNDLSNQQKFQYLRQATVPESRARTVVDSFPASAENYEKALEALKTRFGRDELLVEYYIRQLLKLVTGSQGMKLSLLYDKLETQLRALETLKIVSDNYAAILLPLVESCLPYETLKIWQRASRDPSDSLRVQMDGLMNFLRREVEAEERTAMAHPEPCEAAKPVKGGDRQESRVETRATAADLANVNSAECCIFCGNRHASAECRKAQNMSIQDRNQAVWKARACFGCAQLDHPVARCRAKCSLCQGKHIRLLCPNNSIPPNHVVDKKLTDSCRQESALLSVNHNMSVGTSPQCNEVFLQTFVAVLYNGDFQRKVRVLIDSGSQRSYVLNVLAQELEYQPIGEESLVHSLFGGNSLGLIKHSCYKLRLRSLSNGYACNFTALGQGNIATFIPTAMSNSTVKEELLENRIQLIEDTGGPIDVLIGADIAGKVWAGKNMILPSGIVAIQTLFGWTLMGTSKPHEGTSRPCVTGLATTYTMATITAGDVTDLWRMESIGICDPVDKEDREARRVATMDHFKNTVEFIEGRYRVRLPWTEVVSALPSNREVAEARLTQASRKMNRNSQLFREYDAVFKEWLRLKIIEEISDDESGHYLPHRPVVKESSSTTKVRPVFDASAKARGNPSLNDCLESGPNMIELIPDILKRFREKRIGISADVEKAFLMIDIHPEDRKYLKFLWWNDSQEQKVTYQHARVVFGVTCSPFLLAAVLEHHIERSIAEADENVSSWLKLMKRCFYVDNLASSVDGLTEVCDFQAIATDCMARGGFNLRGWEYSYDSYSEPETMILGMRWHRQEDSLRLNLDWWEKWTQTNSLTKRSVYSMTQRIYDPIGFCTPVTLNLKLMMQRLWEKKLDWDDSLDEDDRKDFEKILRKVPLLRQVAIPRWLGSSQSKTLHLCTDASGKSYSACVFLRSELDDGTVLVNLVEAKSRIVGIGDHPTMPRLELMGVVIGVRLLKSIQDALDWGNLPVYVWCDSSTVLAWVQRKEVWSVFVRNRIKEIHELAPHVHWRHLPGHLNPADLPSRGCTVEQLLTSRWWEGPAWLKGNEDEWPKSHCTYREEEVSAEKLKKVVHDNMFVQNPNHAWMYQYFSRYEKIVRMVGWMQRFVLNARHHRIQGRVELTTQEVRTAELIVCRLVQKEAFSSLNDKRIQDLRPFKDEMGVIRVKTKITERDDDTSFTMPIVLPNNHPVVQRMIYDRHCRLNHVGAQTLWSGLREKFWVIKGRQLTRNIVKKCVTCCRFSSKCFDIESPPLPQARVSDASVFEVCGVDYAGPLNLRDGQKVWVALFTCGVYRAVHLEIVTSLNTEAFLLALRRFISRRGRPKIIYSDNATCFQGADNTFGAIDWTMISKYCTVERIDWRFNPPTGAWWGGFFERMIQTVKRMLRRVLGKAALSLEELYTTLCECECMVNARPITYVSESNGDPMALTPAAFLQDNQVGHMDDCDVIYHQSLERRFQYRQSLREQLRARFRSEYLGNLRWARRRVTREPTIGEIVLIGSDDTKRIDWPLGRVEDIIYGRDGHIRVLSLRTSKGNLTRPLQRVFPLEVEVDYTPKDAGSGCEELDEALLDEKPSPEALDIDAILVPAQESSAEPELQQTRRGRLVKPPKKLDL